jgi:1-aminocyclopropane-1-carboxylate deaminase/D-cysteine desulfhydrase-like pyridoxal-dependent ACC family enzyme
MFAAASAAPGYGIPTDAMLEAVRLLASAEGLLLDPVYSGKAFAGLVAAVRAREIRRGVNLLFIMTGRHAGTVRISPGLQGRLAHPGTGRAVAQLPLQNLWC